MMFKNAIVACLKRGQQAERGLFHRLAFGLTDAILSAVRNCMDCSITNRGDIGFSRPYAACLTPGVTLSVC